MTRRARSAAPRSASGPADIVPFSDALDGIATRAELPAEPVPLADAIEPMLSIDDLARILNGSRRTVERLRSAGKLPAADVHVGKMPRWRPETIRRWIDEQSRRGVK